MVVGVVILGGMLLFGRVLGYGYVWDDFFLIRHRTWSDVFRVFGTNWDWGTLPSVTASYYSPLTTETLILDYALWGLNPMGYHLTNLLFHLANTVAVFWFLTHLTGRRVTQAAGTLIYLVHPFNVGSLAWIGARPYLVAHVFFVLAFVFYLRARRSGRRNARWAMLGTFVVSLLAFEWAIVFPLVVALHTICFHLPRSTEEWAESRRLLVPLLLLAFLYAGFYYWRTSAGEGTSAVWYVLQQSLGIHMLANLGKVVFKVLIPFNEFRNSFLQLSGITGVFYHIGLALLGISWGVFFLVLYRLLRSADRRKQEALRWLAFGIGWMLISVSLVLRSFVMRHGIFMTVGLILQLIWIIELVPKYASRKLLGLAIGMGFLALTISGQIELSRWAPDSPHVYNLNRKTYQYISKESLPPEGRALLEESILLAPVGGGRR